MSTAATTETKPAAPAIEKIKVKVDGREIEVPKLTPDWSGKLDAHDDDSGVRTGQDRRAALLLSSEAAGRRQLPHVPRRIRHARARPGPQAGVESRRHAENRQVAASGHRLRHADFARHGNLHEDARRETDARRRAGIAAHQPSARLPDLRPGRRMQVAGILRGLRPEREPLRRAEGSQAQGR